MKASEAKAELLKINGTKMVDRAIKKINEAIDAGSDGVRFADCKSQTVFKYVRQELEKMGYKTRETTEIDCPLSMNIDWD